MLLLCFVLAPIVLLFLPFCFGRLKQIVRLVKFLQLFLSVFICFVFCCLRQDQTSYRKSIIEKLHKLQRQGLGFGLRVTKDLQNRAF